MPSNLSIPTQCNLQKGTTVDGKYIVEQLLGEGAFGQVFKVKDLSGCIYALKVLMLWKIEPEIRSKLVLRFDMEYETSRINSDYLVRSVDKGIVNGNPYIVMEYCPGGDLMTAAEKGRITDFSAVAMGILSGLKDLHRNGKVHRDLKPENVLLRSDGTAVLTDFGISGDRNKRMTERNIVGTPKEIFGTYAYMPPEQVNPKRGDATVLPTTDIYSFGVMMYQILTFEMPFGNLSNHADLVPYLDKSKKGQWDRRCLAQARNGYGSRWLNVIDGCLNPDYTKRLSSVDEVMALIPHSAGLRRPVPVKPDSGETGKVTGKILLRMMHGEEYGQTYPLAELLAGRKNILTVGRKDPYIKNDIEITENHSTYISRKHCTIEYDRSRSRWIVRDGQWVTSPVAQWKDSLNGTYVNSFKVSQSGLLIKTGDIISIGDVKLRVEEY